MRLEIFVLAICVISAFGHPKKGETRDYHSKARTRSKRSLNFNSFNGRSFENTTDYWRQQAQLTLNHKLHERLNTNIAKNVILFLGDGMSLATLAGARAYLGQKNGMPGEETVLSFEEFPHTGLSKTYCVDSQVADSACSATAYLCGIKGSIATIGYNGNVREGDWKAGLNDSYKVSSIARWAQLMGKKTGLVTTTRVTHASPAGIYSQTAHRDWESDFDIIDTGYESSKIIDIATQLIKGETGRDLDVIMGGGRSKFLPNTLVDEEGEKGERLDGVNLIDQWKSCNDDIDAQYVWDREGLLNLNRDNTDKVLGLFESSHTKYNLDREPNDPSLSEMTETAIRLVENNEQGYFLFIEGGRIDHGHHETRAMKALDETVEFSEAIRKARHMTDERDTLIIVTSDHAHTMTLSGYADRGTDIFKYPGIADDNLPYPTLSYANGPGYRKEENGKRHDISQDNTHDKEYQSPTLAPLEDETHGGEDVGIFALGPWSHLFVGVLEQNVIPHLIAYASCIGDGITVCDEYSF